MRTFLFALLLAFGLACAPAMAQEQAPSTFRDCENCPEMVAMAPGTFQMGMTPKEQANPMFSYDTSGLPRHEVDIAYPFAIGRFEVTTGEFDAYVRETGATVGGICGIRLIEAGKDALKFTGTPHPGNNANANGPYYIYITDGSYAQPGLAVTDRQPAVCVSRQEVMDYLAWLGKKTSRHYRLPTEAEWEYADRAGTNTVTFWGNDFKKACTYANFGDSASGYQAGMMAPCAEKLKPKPEWSAGVGSYKPNPWGLYDMQGNVQEMLEDCRHDTYDGAPNDGSPWSEPDCLLFVARGGDYELPHLSMRASERLFFGYADEDSGDVQGKDSAWNGRSNVMGFRVAVSLDATSWDRQQP